MSLGWKSTINNSYLNPKSLPAALELTIPSLIKDEIQRLANLSLFQKNVIPSDTSISQVLVDLKVTENSLNIRVSKESPWISLLPSYKQSLTPEEKAIDAVRQEVMKKIAVLWGGVTKTSLTESDSGETSSGSSSTRVNQRIDQRSDCKRDSSEEESKDSSTNSFSSKHQMKHSSSNYSDTSELEDSSSEESNNSSNSSFHMETIPIDSLTVIDTSFTNPETDETLSSGIEEGFVMIPSSSELTEEKQYTPPVKTGIISRIKKIWENISHIDLFNSKTWNVTNSVQTTVVQPDLQNQSKKDLQILPPETVETFPENSYNEKTLDSKREEDFVIIASSELTEEMQRIAPVKTSITSRSQNVTNPLKVNVSQSNFYDHSDKDFQILTPIIKDLTNITIDPTSLSIAQIKKDLGRMKIHVNGFHCVNIKDFTSHLGLTLNPEETDIAQSNHTIIRKILHFAHQGLFYPGTREIWEKITTLSDNVLMPAQLDTFGTIDIDWNPEFPEQTEIIGEVFFQLKYARAEPNLVPNSMHLLKMKSSFPKQEQQITFIKAPQKRTDELEDDFEIIETPGTKKEPGKKLITDSSEIHTKNIEASSDYQFENIDIDNAVEMGSTLKSTFDYLFTKTDAPLRPGITSDYLHTLKNKCSNFIYDDRLMYGNIPVSMDAIIDLLHALKNQRPENQMIFLPFLVKGWSVDHAVVAVVNLSNETIEYFDPKGQSWLTTRIEKQSNKNVFDFLTEIGKKVISPTFSKEKIVYNKKNVPQGMVDNINCGVFCLQFIEERLNHSFDAIENGIMGKLTNPLHIRQELANKFQERFETAKINTPFTINSSSEEERKMDDPLPILLEYTEESVADEPLENYELVDSSDIERMPLLPISSIPTKRSTPLFFSPKNPFHLGKYSHLLRIIKENFSKFSSDDNLATLKTILNQDNLDSREKYRKYVEELRKLLQDTTLEESTRTNLEKLCYAQFTTNVMTNFIEHFLQETTNHTLQSPSELTMHTIADAIITTNNQLKDSPSKKELIALYSQKLSGELGINFDPTKYSNIPEVRSIHTVKSSSKKEPYQIIYLRHGTPTIETGFINPPQSTDNFLTYPLRRLGGTLFKNYRADTIPEYGAFLNRARDLNTPVFYVNHQSMISKTSSEYSRSRAIQNHEITHPDHFFFMTLPFDGKILDYVQNTDQWKKELIDNLTNEKNGFILPTKLKNDFAEDKEILNDQFKHLLDRLHDLYFANQPLRYTDQQVLLMIFYSYLKDFIKEKYQIQIMVSACKDNKDRGNTSSSIDEALYNLRLGKENDPHALYDLYIRFFAPFLIKYEPIIPHRFKLFIDILQHITTLTDIQKQAIRQFQINNFEILDQKVPR